MTADYRPTINVLLSCPSSSFVRSPNETCRRGTASRVERAKVWTLRKGARVASCYLWTHPIGAEVRVTVDGEFLRSEAKWNGLELVDLALEWKQQFQEKGWNT